jgi:hypothetical protein
VDDTGSGERKRGRKKEGDPKIFVKHPAPLNFANA